MIYTLMLVVFVLGYAAIAFEHQLKIDKAAAALVTGVVTWTLYVFGSTGSVEGELLHHLSEIASILFFLIGAMTIVELVDAHEGFSVITDKIRTTNKVKLMWIIGILSFFFSAALDNLTTSIVMVSLLRKLIEDKKDRWFFAGMVVVAANAGGAWSPIGDVTTTMLWIGGQISAGEIIKVLIIPSIFTLLVPLIILPIGILFGLSLRRPLETYTKQNMTEANLRNGLLIESLDGIEGVKAAGGNSTFAHRWFGLTEAVSDGELKVKRLSALSSNFSQSLQQLSYVGIVAYGAVLVTQGELTMGALIACSILSGRALGAFSQFPNMLVQAKKSKIALEALTGAMRLSADRDGTHRRAVLDKPVGALASDALQFGYDPSLLILELPALEFKPGERVAVLGSVGSGKSTLVRLLAGLYQPSQGSVRYDGYDFNLLNPDFLREQILYLPQEARLFGGTLRENLTLGLPMVAESELAEACAKTGLDQVIAGHPHGLELRISEGGQGLSGGQKQLVAFTRALLANPSIVLLDEPMASMDRGLEERLMGLLLGGLPKDTTVILVTHKLQHVRRVDRVMILERGKLVIDGPSAEVMAQMQRSAPAEGKS